MPGIRRVFLAATITLLPCLRGDRLDAVQARGEGTTVQRMIISSPARGEESRSGGGEGVSLVRSAHAVTSTLTTKKTKDVALGEVIQIGTSKFVRIGDNRWMALDPIPRSITCGANSHVNEYNQAKCSCDAGYALADGHTTYTTSGLGCDTTESQLIADNITSMADWGDCTTLESYETIYLKHPETDVIYPIKKFPTGANGGICVTNKALTYRSQSDAANFCRAISGWGQPYYSTMRGIFTYEASINPNCVYSSTSNGDEYYNCRANDEFNHSLGLAWLSGSAGTTYIKGKAYSLGNILLVSSSGWISTGSNASDIVSNANSVICVAI